MNEYEQKKQARIDRYRELSGKASARSDALSKSSQDMIHAIPMGQPVHGQRDQNYRDRAWNKLGRSIEEQKKADYYAAKAEAAECNTAISGDDPDAISKLEEKLDDLKSKQSFMKGVNAYYRKHSTCKGYEGLPDESAQKLDDRMKTAYSWEAAPFPSYSLTNNSSEINRTAKRIESLRQTQEMGFIGWTFDGGEVVANAEANRLQILFDQKPDEQKRMELKKAGFHWSPSEKAWQRQLNRNAIFAASYLDCIKPLSGENPLKMQPRAPKKELPER